MGFVTRAAGPSAPSSDSAPIGTMRTKGRDGANRERRPVKETRPSPLVLRWAAMERSGWFARRRQEQALEWMRDALVDGLQREVRRNAAVSSRLAAMEKDVAAGRVSPFRGARELLGLLRK